MTQPPLAYLLANSPAGTPTKAPSRRTGAATAASIGAAAVVDLRGIGKTYGAGTAAEQQVLRDIDLTLGAGEFVALTGPSGSGKSTLLNLIGLLDRASAGRYRLRGRDVTSIDEAERSAARLSHLGFVFQFHHLLPAFSTLENVMLPGLMRDGTFTAQVRADAFALLEAIGLGGAGAKKPAQLSGGMQQRAAIARALVLSPDLILADEPTGNLDTHTADDVFALMRRFNRERGTAFLIVTHDRELAARCDRQIHLVDGRFDGTGSAAYGGGVTIIA